MVVDAKTKRPMIVFCHLLNDLSGSPIVLRSSIDVLRDPDCQDILCVGANGRGALTNADIPTLFYPYRRGSTRMTTLVFYLRSQFKLYRALSAAREIESDAIVYVNTLLPFGASLWGWRTGRKVITHVHEVSLSPAPLRWFLTACARMLSDQMIYVSQDHMQRMAIKGPKGSVLHNAVSTPVAGSYVDYAPRRAGRFTVLMLASLRDYKGVPEFVALARRFHDRPDLAFSLVLNADDIDVAAFQKQHADVETLTIHPKTQSPADHYRTADLVLNLSRPDLWIETFGLTLIEAMHFAIPVIGPPVGGPAEIIDHDETGFCIDARDGAALAAAVLAIADDTDKAMKMSKAARLRAQDFTLDRFAARLRAIVDTVR